MISYLNSCREGDITWPDRCFPSIPRLRSSLSLNKIVSFLVEMLLYEINQVIVQNSSLPVGEVVRRPGLYRFQYRFYETRQFRTRSLGRA